MDAKARSVSFMRVTLNHRRDAEAKARCRTSPWLEDSFPMTEIPEVADVRDDERETELILRAHLPEV